jgi:hypothetical protein
MEKYHYSSTSGMITLTATGLRHLNVTNDGTSFSDEAMTSRSVLSLHSLKRKIMNEVLISLF